jgi:DNA-binding NarL/FixJ family response regulator
LAKIKVIIVEDLDEIRQGFTFLVNSSDELECIGSYSSAEDALSEIKNNIPDVIIMDIGLPGISGIECTVLIKKLYPSIQILMCTIYEDDQRLFNALASGANGYILKRTAPGILLQCIKDVYKGGAPMSSQIARRVVESFQPSVLTEKAEDEYNLSKREKEILDLLADGYRNKEISKRLFISEHTVKSHIYHIYDKLHVKSRIEAITKISAGK